MKTQRFWRRLATSLVLTLLPAAAALAQKGGTEPSLALEEVESGKGWKRLVAIDQNIATKGATPAPMADLLVVSFDGIEDLPISQMHKDELYEDFALGGAQSLENGTVPTSSATDELVIIDYAALDQIESGIWRPEYLAMAEPDEPLVGETPSFGCSGWRDRNKTKTWNLSSPSISGSYPLGGGFTGSYNFSLPVASTGTAKLSYQIKKNFLCIPYKFRVKRVEASGQASLGGSGQLQASASRDFKWEKDWEIANVELGRVTFWVGFIPVWIDFSLPIHAGLKLDAKFSATLSQDFALTGTGSFNYVCTSSGCTGNNTFQNAFTTSGLNASLQADVDAEANAKVQVRAEVWSGSLLNAQAGVKGYVKANVWGYYGNTCGDGNGDGNNETVRALLAQANAGFDVIYSIGGSLVPDKSGSIPIRSFDLGWWDLLGPGGSTVLSPMIAGPATAQVGETVSYVVKMRPCYPYTQAVNLQMAPGPFTGTLRIAKPKSNVASENSTTLSRSFASTGNQTIVATAVSDQNGRSLNAATSRGLQVQPPPSITPRGGMWYNPDRSGNGLELFVNMYNQYAAIWYTYEGTEPVWYITDVATVSNNSWSAPLYRSVWAWNGTTHTNSITEVGWVGFSFTSDIAGTFVWNLNGQNGTEPFELLFQGTGRSGSWYPPSESGWGMSIAENATFANLTFQYYDQAGQPTWVMGTAAPGVNLWASSLTRYHATGLCPGCTGPITRWNESAGTAYVVAVPQYSHLLVSTGIPNWDRFEVPFYQLATH